MVGSSTIVIVVGVLSSLSLTSNVGTATSFVPPGLTCKASVLSSASGFLLIPKFISLIFSLSTSTAISPSAFPSNPTRPIFSPSALFQLVGSVASLELLVSVNTMV